MPDAKKIDIEKQIFLEKIEYIKSNCTFFCNQFNNVDKDKIENINLLKNLLINPAPLSQCHEFEELNSKVTKIKNQEDLIYQNSIKILFGLVYKIRYNSIMSKEAAEKQVEVLRKYVKYLTTGKDFVYYNNQKSIIIDKEKADKILKKDYQNKKNK